MESAKSRLIGDIVLTQRETWMNLMVTGGCWFLYDVGYCYDDYDDCDNAQEALSF